MKEKMQKFFLNLLICVIFLAAALLLAYGGYTLLFGAWGDQLQEWIRRLTM